MTLGELIDKLVSLPAYQDGDAKIEVVAGFMGGPSIGLKAVQVSTRKADGFDLITLVLRQDE